VVFESYMSKKSQYLDIGLALNRFLPWYMGIFFSAIVFFFTYFIFYKFNFYFFIIFFILLCAIISITAFSTINALIFLIITYLLSSFVFFLAGLDFLALVLIFIYVGAIAILFLFVIMTLTNEKIVKFSNFSFFDRINFFIFFMSLFLFLVLLVQNDFYYDTFYRFFLINSVDLPFDTNYYYDPLIEIGLLLYGRQMFLFIMITLILFLGFFCPIILTLEEDDGSRLPNKFSLSYPHQFIQNFASINYYKYIIFNCICTIFFAIYFINLVLQLFFF
jgi:NADH-quinone oxidoreductase subunit J